MTQLRITWNVFPFHLHLHLCKEVISFNGTSLNTITHWQVFCCCWVGVTVYLASWKLESKQKLDGQTWPWFWKVQNSVKKSSPQVSEFFSVCLVRPTCTHCRRHWTRRGSPKGDRKIIRTLILQRYVWYGLVVEMTKPVNFSIYELWIWRICPPDRYCVCGSKIENIVKVSTKFCTKTVKVGLNCEIIGFLLFLRISPIQGVLTINICFKNFKNIVNIILLFWWWRGDD